MQGIVSACTYDCPDCCSIIVRKSSDGTVSVRGNPDHPYTAGFACSKIKNHLRRLKSPNRIFSPLLKRGSEWRSITWDQALDLCAENIDKLRHEPRSILHVNCEGDHGVVKLMVKDFFAALGARQTVGTQLCNAAGLAACEMDFGAVCHNDIDDLLNSGAIVNWGRDLSRNWLHMAAMVRRARKKGCRLITIAPASPQDAELMGEFIPIRPGSDRFLAAAVLKTMFEKDRIAVDLIRSASGGWAFREMILAQDRDALLQACGVESRSVKLLADVYGGSQPVATLIAWALQRYASGGQNVRLINALTYLSGNVGTTGAGSYYAIPSSRDLNLSWARNAFSQKVQLVSFPRIAEEIENADPPIQMLWVNGSNFVNQVPECEHVVRALTKIPFKVVVDAFFTDTAEQANLILPCALMMEKEDIVASYCHNYVNHAGVVFDPPGQAKTDDWIMTRLGKRLKPAVEVLSREEILRLSLNSPLLDIDLDEFRRRGWVRSKRPTMAFAEGRFDHPDGTYHLPNEQLRPETEPTGEYPYRLLSLGRREAIHSQILPEDHPSHPVIWVTSGHPARQKLDLTKPTYLVSPIGRLRVIVENMEGLTDNLILYRRGDWRKLGGGVNQLISARTTDIGGLACYYEQHVRLEN